MSNQPRILARDRRTGKLVLFHVLPDGRFVVETQYGDCLDQCVESAAVIRAEQPDNWKGNEHLVMKIPMPLHQQLRNEGRVQNVEDFKKWINDSDHSKLRTKRGRV